MVDEVNKKNPLEKLVNALIGVPAASAQPEQSTQPVYPEEMQNYFNTLPKQSYAKGLFNQSKEGQPDATIFGQIASGLNNGIPQIAQEQAKWGISIPKTEQDIKSAGLGRFNQYPMQLNAGAATAPRQGGILRNLERGYRENYHTPISVENLMPQGRNLATKLGEGLGTVGRFVDSPLGRGVMAGGLSAFTGRGDAMGEFVTATVGRQKARTADKIYRNQLNQMGMSEQETQAISGNVTDEIYKNVSLGQYRNRGLDIREDLANTTIEQKKSQIRQMDEKLRLLEIQINDKRISDQVRAGLTAQRNSILASRVAVQNAVDNDFLAKGGWSDNTSSDNTGNRNIVPMKAPNGKIVLVPKDRVNDAIQSGGVIYNGN